MGRKLAAYVHVAGQRFAPGDEPPAEVANLITNPQAWEADNDQPQDGAGAGIGNPPPTAGAGSGKAAWRDYADANGVTVDDDASRDDVIEACRAAGIRTE